MPYFSIKRSTYNNTTHNFGSVLPVKVYVNNNIYTMTKQRYFMRRMTWLFLHNGLQGVINYNYIIFHQYKLLKTAFAIQCFVCFTSQSFHQKSNMTTMMC